jgi:tetratricopeptide (TPR) repeat protein
MTGRVFAIAAAILALSSADLVASQPTVERQRAKVQNQAGWDHMKSEAFEEAAKAFQLSIDIDPEFEMPHYGLGRANMALKKYVAAIAALSRCRELYRAQVGRQFSNQQEAQRYRNNRITELDEMIRQVQSGPPSLQAQDQMRQLQEQKRQMQEAIARGNDVSIEASVPAWVSLSLGSAFFRAGRLADAEREYKEAIIADKRSGEAHNNLAVVFLETGRIADADASIKSAKKTGFKVNPQLEKAIKDRLRD